MRSLPSRRNPLIAEDKAPSYDELIERRRLGRTTLSVKPERENTSSSTKTSALGPIEYAHLRAPLPPDLTGSEVHHAQPGQTHPQTYFLMRRSKDGYVSATGMFKIAFPWAKHSEEKAELDYLKTLSSTGQDEVAGNLWITAESALELASDYGLDLWIRALLDPLDIAPSPKSARKNIAAPPKFEMPLAYKDVTLSPPSTASKSTRSRGARASSPSKTAARPKASPRKRRTKKEREESMANASAASATLQDALDESASVAEGTPAPESVLDASEVDAVGDALDDAAKTIEPASATEPTVKVHVDQEVEVVNGETEITHTNVTVEMPTGLSDLPLPEDAEAMLETARRMVQEAKEIDGAMGTSRKRGFQEVEASDIDGELPVAPAKRARVLQEKLKREKVRTRAVIGVAASLAFAVAIPFLQNLF